MINRVITIFLSLFLLNRAAKPKDVLDGMEPSNLCCLEEEEKSCFSDKAKCKKAPPCCVRAWPDEFFQFYQEGLQGKKCPNYQDQCQKLYCC